MIPNNLALILFLCLAVPGAAAPLFEKASVPAHVYAGGWTHFVGGGVAVFDCDDDGLPELFAAGGEAPSQLFRNRARPGSELAFEAAPSQALNLTGVTGAYPLDVDSDGRLDLVILRVGTNRLLKGGRDCQFTPFEAIGFTSEDRWTTAFSATWEAGHDWPTLAFGNYVDRFDPEGPFRRCDANLLYRPEPGGFAAPLLLTPGYCALSMLFSDWARNGRADLRISNDRHYYVDDGQEQMWAMTEPPVLLGPEDGWRRHQLWGMGIASRDLDGDGRAEVFLSSMGDQRLQRLQHPQLPDFVDVPFEVGTTAHRPYVGGDGRPSTGWHIAVGDVQNDGLDDIFIAKGNVDQMPDSAMADPNNLLIQQPGYEFVEAGASAGLDSLHRGRGAALVDLNRDGRLDVVVVNRRAEMEVYRNVTARTGHFLSLQLQQAGPNTRAIGAFIEVKTADRLQTREITLGGGHAGGSAVPEHFGLGSADRAELRVIWPDGQGSDWIIVEADRAMRLLRDGQTVALQPY